MPFEGGIELPVWNAVSDGIKVIIMNADGKTVDVKEGEEAREFMLEEGGEVSLARLKEE